jgi:hypothetical protein
LKKIDFQPKVINKDKEGHFILIKSKIFQDELSILNIYAPNARTPIFMNATLLKIKAHIAPHRIIVGNFNTPFSAMDRTWKQKLSRHSKTNRSYQPNIYRTFYPKTKEYTFFSAPHATSCKSDHIISHKTGLTRYKKIEII